MFMKSHEEMIQSLYARREAYERKKLKRKRATIRVTGIAACFVLCTAVVLGSYQQSEPPVTPSVSEESEQSLQSESSAGDSFTEGSSEQPDVSSLPPEEDAFCGYSEIILVDENAEVNEIVFGNEAVTNPECMGQALQTKLVLMAHDPDYLFDVVVFLDKCQGDVQGGITVGDLSVGTIPAKDWMALDLFEDQSAYYCRLTAAVLYELNKGEILCLYVGSGEGALPENPTRWELIEQQCELYGDGLIGVKQNEEKEKTE